jgi:hypothetical protein
VRAVGAELAAFCARNENVAIVAKSNTAATSMNLLRTVRIARRIENLGVIVKAGRTSEAPIYSPLTPL